MPLLTVSAEPVRGEMLAHAHEERRVNVVRVYAIPSLAGGYAQYLELDCCERAYWAGRAAEILELEGDATREQFTMLEKGIDPNTGDVLRPRVGLSMTHNGKPYAVGRSAYDVVVMAPKSAAIVGLFDERVINAHRQAVREAVRDVENHASVRVRKGEAHDDNGVRPSRNIVAGVWLHKSNRALEPLLHSHACVVNLSYDPVEHQWKALQAVDVYRNRQTITEDYRHKLAELLGSYGYETEKRLVSETRYPKEQIKAREWGFEIA